MNLHRLKKTSSLILLTALFLFIPFAQIASSEELPQASNEFYVYDEANIINGDVKEYIVKTNEELFQKTGAQIVVATINSLQGETIEEFSNKLYRKWEIGSAQDNNGILLLIALQEQQLRIEVGYGLEGALPDGKAGEIRDQYLTPNFQEGEYNQGILKGYQAILNVVEKEYQVEINVENQLSQDDYNNSQEKSNEGPGLLQKIIIIIVLIIFLFVDFTFFGGMLTLTLLRSVSRSRGGGGGSGGNRGGGGSSGGGGASGGW